MLITLENPISGLEGFYRKMQNILRAKCIVIGDSAVGKSCIVHAFSSESSNFQKNYSMTCTVDLRTKKVSIPDTNDVVEVYFYDFSGKDMYSDVVSLLWQQPSVMCIVFDVTREKSFQKCAHWLDEIQKSNSSLNVPGVLIGNKVDLEKRRTVSDKEASEFAQNHNLRYFECSTKENIGIEEPFFYLVNEWHKMYMEKTEMFKTLS